MSDSTYNGWTNRETWAVNAFIDNEFAAYKTKCRFLRAHSGARMTRSLVEEFCRDVVAGSPKESWLTVEELDAVNWEEVTEHFQTEADELEDE